MKNWIDENFFILNHDYLDFSQDAQKFYFYIMNQYKDEGIKAVVALGMKRNFECVLGDSVVSIKEHLKSMNLVLKLLHRIKMKCDSNTPHAKKLAIDVSNGYKILVSHCKVQGYTITDF